MYASASPRLDLKNSTACHLDRVFRVVALWCLVLGWTGSLQADTFGDFTYEVVDGAVSITGYTGSGGAVTVPSEINGLPVSGIVNWSPYGDKVTTSVNIPSSVSYLGEAAFSSCTSLTGVSIPETITSIGRGAFSDCTSLTSITLPSSVRDIRDNVFSGCASLTVVSIPSGVTHIGDSAFASCTGLTSVTIPSSVTNIGDGAFAGCTSLTGVSIPASVTAIGRYAFADCTNLTGFTVDSANPVYASAGGVLFNKSASILIQVPRDLSGTYSIPANVTTIESRAFYRCTGLTGVSIPPSVIHIKDDAFYGCTGLTSMAIPPSVQYMGFAFDGCTSLTDIIVDPANPIYASTGGVLFDKSLKTLIQAPDGLLGPYSIPSSVTDISNGAFSGCTNIISIAIPPSVTYIGEDAFSGATSLIKIDIPLNVNHIGRRAFHNCNKLTGISVDQANSFYASADGVLFDKTFNILIKAPGALSGAYSIPSTVTFVGNDAFAYCSGVTSISIPKSVTSIWSRAFEGCTGLTGVTIPNGVTSIEYYAFASCTSLMSATFNGPAPTMGDGIFYGTATGFSVHYPSWASGFTTPTWLGYPALPFVDNGRTAQTLTFPSLPNRAWGDAPFTISATSSSGLPVTISVVSGSATVSGLTVTLTGPGSVTLRAEQAGDASYLPAAPVERTFTVTSDFTHAASGDAVTITGYTGSAGAVTIPSEIDGLPVTSIGDHAFSDHDDLTSVSIPEGITTIGAWAFYHCESLTSVTLPASVTIIGDSAFYDCTGLTSVSLAEGVTTIGQWAFSYCDNLISVTLPSSVTNLGEYAFYHCSSLTGMNIPAAVAHIGDSAFSSCSALTGITVDPANSNYASVNGVLFDKAFHALLQAPGTLSGDYVIPASVNSISDRAFFLCNGLTGISLPASLVTIGEYAFAHCYGLTSMNLPASVTSIGNGAFASCYSLTGITVDPANSAYASASGVLFDKAYHSLLQAPLALSGAYTIPAGVVSIGDSAFTNCSGLTSIGIPASVSTIGDSAFYNCPSLTSVIFVGNAPTLGDSAFPTDTSGFTLYYPQNASGFTTPTWNGYTTQAYDKTPQFITFSPVENLTWGDAPFTLDATSSSGLPVTLEVVSGPATLSGTTLTLTGAGTVIVRASQSGNATYAAAVVDQSFTVDKATASVTLGNLTATYNGSPKAATAQTLPASLPVTLTYAGSATAPTAAGSYAVVGTINHANYQGSVSGTLVISKASQTITFAALGTKIYGSTPIVLAATASSGLAVTYTKVSGPATLSGNKLTLTGAGTVVVRASQAGNTSYSAAPSVDRSITSIKSPSAAKVTLGGLSTTYNGSTKTITATTSPSGLGVKITYNGSTTVPKNAGSYAIVATVTDPNYKGKTAKVTGTLVIKKASQTVTFAGPGNRIYTATPIPLAATASSGLPVTFSVVSGPAKISGTELTLTGLGTVKLRASQAGNSNYASASLDRTITVGKSAEMVYLSKGRLYTQSSATSVKLADSEALPYSFWADVDAGSGSKVRATSAKLTPAPRITLPGTSTFKSATGQTPALGLGEDDDSGWNFGYVGQDYFDNWESPTKSQIDAYFPPGDYVFSIQGKRFALKLPPDSYPQAPVITLSGGSWSDGVYRIRANKTLTIGTGTYSAYGTHANNGISLGMHDQTTGNSVFDYSHAAKPIAYFGLPVSSAKSYTRTIAANTLKAGHRYEVDGVFIAAFTQGTPLPGCTSLVTYETSTEVFIEVINP